MSDAAHAHEEHEVHVLPMRVLVVIYLALLVLTVLTVVVWMINLGPTAIVVSLGIALVKASLVALYFMHLRYDSLFNGIVLVSALLFVVLFITISLLDTNQYQPDRLQYQQQQAVESAG